MASKTRRIRHLAGLLCGGALLAATAFAKHSDDQLPERFRASPYSIMSLSVGAPQKGWQLRSKRLNSTPYLTVKSGSENSVYGHPALVLMLERTAKQMVRNVDSEPLLVGDLSLEFGGPLYGHKSHQSGRDADVGFFALDSKGRTKKLEHFVAFDAQGRAKDRSGLVFDDYRNWLMVLSWLKDERADIRHVFVEAHLRRRLLEFARARPAFAGYVDAAAKFLLQPQNADPHDDHFHVRIRCPKRQTGLCVDYGR
jgi:penicillin-insensitive murein endopeptidase